MFAAAPTVDLTEHLDNCIVAKTLIVTSDDFILRSECCLTSSLYKYRDSATITVFATC